MKSSVETLSPTRVKLTIEVPFDELGPSLDAAYKRFGRQVKVQGFRPGKVPARILDQRVGRGAILEEALQDAVTRCYAEAVRETELRVAGRPEIELSSFGDGEPLLFTATVDVRPEIELPAYDGLAVTVDEVGVTEADVDGQLGGLQDRFAVLQPAERAVQLGDYVQIDLRATKDGELIPGSEASGLSYEVGSDGLVPGLDRALVGLSAGEQKSFDAEIGYGELAGTEATFDVTVTAVKVKEVPPLDDDFAATASEFDTIGELRGEIRGRMERIRKLEQAEQARDRILDTLIGMVDVPLPEAMVAEEYDWRRSRMEQQLEQAGLTLAQFVAESGRAEEDIERELREAAEQSVKAQLLLDAIGVKEQLSVTEADLTDQVVRRAVRAGVRPDDLAKQLVDRGELSELMGEIVRGKALATIVSAAKVVDTAGNPVDLSELRDELSQGVDVAPTDEHEDHEGHDHS